jgi:hypothetical protein
MYRKGKTLHEVLASETAATEKSVAKDFHNPLEMLNNLLDAEFEIVDNTAWLLGQRHLNGRSATEVAVFAAIHKNFFLFHSAIKLAKSGLYGPAETLLRPIFESLYIAKYCALSKNELTFAKWRDGEYVHLTNDVFNRIKSSDLSEARILWKALNQLSHATVYAQQISASYEEIKTEIGVCLSIVQVLAVLNQHLLTQHYLTPQVIRYTKIHGNPAVFETARHRARKQAEVIRSGFTAEAKRVVHEYVSTWVIKS